MKTEAIDVSKYQGEIDWKKVKESGIESAIIRAGYGRDTMDKYFAYNAEQAIANDIPVGFYWFIYATSINRAIENADMFHSLIKKYKDKITMKVWADWEYDSDNNSIKNGVVQTKESRTLIVKAFLKRLQEYGYEVGVYANPDYINGKFGDLSEYPLWLAWYGGTEEDIKKYNPFMWQYSSKGTVPGIEGNVDMNYCYGELPKQEKETEEKAVEVNTAGKISVNYYSKAKEGNVKLSANFKAKEFACNDGSDPIFISPSLVEVLQKIRSHFGKAVNINSGYRTPTYNKKVGGATYSQHLYGTAADIRINGVKPKDIAAYAETLLPNTGGIGIYNNFVHVDVRKTKSRWNG